MPQLQKKRQRENSSTNEITFLFPFQQNAIEYAPSPPTPPAPPTPSCTHCSAPPPYDFVTQRAQSPRTLATRSALKSIRARNRELAEAKDEEEREERRRRRAQRRVSFLEKGKRYLARSFSRSDSRPEDGACADGADTFERTHSGSSIEENVQLRRSQRRVRW